MPSDNVFERAMLNIQTKLCTFNIHNFVHLYSESDPVFCAVNDSFENYCFNVNDSLEIIIKLLSFQLNVQFEEPDIQDVQITSFIRDVYDVLEKQKPKTNTLYIHSPPSAGKNFFIDALLAF